MEDRLTSTNRTRVPAATTPGAEGAQIDIADPEGRLGPTLGWVRERATAASAYLQARGEVRVRVVGDAEMASAHERFSNIPGTTDVLTFDLAGGTAHEHGLDVDILICADVASREAAARGLPPEREALLYIVHGMLHCLGHDDHDEGDAVAMHRREDEILEAIGVGRTYALAATATPGAQAATEGGGRTP